MNPAHVLRRLLLVLVLLPGLASAADRAKAAPFDGDDLDGKRVSSKDFLGKPLIITFWATWCVPCKKAIPEFEKLLEQHGDKVAAVAISIDDTRTQSRVRGTVKRYKWKLPVLIDERGDIARSLNPRGLAPYTLVLDGEGHIAFAREGFSAGDEALYAEWLEKLLAEGAEPEAEKAQKAPKAEKAQKAAEPDEGKPAAEEKPAP